MLGKKGSTTRAFVASPLRRRRRRSAMILLELVALVAIIASIMSLSAVVMLQAFRAHSEALKHLRQTEQLQQLVQRWRQDVHAAAQVELLQGDLLEHEWSRDAVLAGEIPNGEEHDDGAVSRVAFLQLTDPTNSKQITYHQTRNGLLRELREGAALVATEQWTLPESGHILFSIDESGRRTVVTARLEYAPASPLTTIEWIACAEAPNE